MTAWQSISYVPVHFLKFIRKLKCPICSGPLSEDEENCFGLTDSNSDYVIMTSCPIDNHYSIDLSGDSRKVSISSEQIEFQFDWRDFLIQKDYQGALVTTTIKTCCLDEVGNPDTDTDKMITAVFERDYFNFKKFNAYKFASLVNTLIIFK